MNFATSLDIIHFVSHSKYCLLNLNALKIQQWNTTSKALKALSLNDNKIPLQQFYNSIVTGKKEWRAENNTQKIKCISQHICGKHSKYS